MQPTTPPPVVSDDLLTDPEVSRTLGVSLRLVKELRFTGDLPFVVLRRSASGRPTVVRVRRSDLDDFIARRREPSRHEPRRGPQR